jgi:signal transduction histidine kinase
MGPGKIMGEKANLEGRREQISSYMETLRYNQLLTFMRWTGWTSFLAGILWIPIGLTLKIFPLQALGIISLIVFISSLICTKTARIGHIKTSLYIVAGTILIIFAPIPLLISGSLALILLSYLSVILMIGLLISPGLVMGTTAISWMLFFIPMAFEIWRPIPRIALPAVTFPFTVIGFFITGYLIHLLAENSKKSEQKYRELSENLEILVSERTSQLESSNKELEAFCYSVSHDLRAPLRHISGFSEILQQKFGTTLNKDTADYLEKIKESADKMNVLINELLGLSRIGRKKLNLKRTDLNIIINEVLDELEPDIKKRKIEWNIKKLPEVICDPALITIVVKNLLTNAIKFTGKTPRAVIKIDPLKNKKPGFSIQDNGAGFDMTYVDKLFSPFQRLHKSEEFEGVGIGLATVQRIISKHGGRVWAEAEIDKGATFSVELGSNKEN